jgi:hypothetical protein
MECDGPGWWMFAEPVEPPLPRQAQGTTSAVHGRVRLYVVE